MLKRRQFLKYTSSILGAGLLPASAFLANTAVAQVNGNDAKKLMFVFTPNGATQDSKEYWHPAPGTLDLRPMTAPLEPVKQHCLFVDGLTMYGGGGSHDGGVRTVLTANGPDSLDIVFGEHYKNETPFSSLQMGPLCRRNMRGNCSYKSGNPIPHDDKPIALYKKLWDASPDQAGSQKDLGILSAINKDMDKLKKRLGSAERIKLEQHTDSLSQLERRLLSVSSQLEKPDIDFRGITDEDFRNDSSFFEMSAVMQDIAVAALSMGLTRSINFSFGERTFTGTMPGHNYGDHAASHQGGDTHAQAKQYWMAEVTKLIQRIEGTSDGTGTLLDNTLMMHYSEVGSGNSHNFLRMPFILAGGKNWGLNSGTTIQYEHNPHGPAHHKLLTAIAQRAGLPIDHFGDGVDGHRAGSGLGVGPLQGIFS